MNNQLSSKKLERPSESQMAVTFIDDILRRIREVLRNCRDSYGSVLAVHATVFPGSGAEKGNLAMSSFVRIYRERLKRKGVEFRFVQCQEICPKTKRQHHHLYLFFDGRKWSRGFYDAMSLKECWEQASRATGAVSGSSVSFRKWDNQQWGRLYNLANQAEMDALYNAARYLAKTYSKDGDIGRRFSASHIRHS